MRPPPPTYFPPAPLPRPEPDCNEPEPRLLPRSVPPPPPRGPCLKMFELPVMVVMVPVSYLPDILRFSASSCSSMIRSFSYFLSSASAIESLSSYCFLSRSSRMMTKWQRYSSVCSMAVSVLRSIWTHSRSLSSTNFCFFSISPFSSWICCSRP